MDKNGSKSAKYPYKVLFMHGLESGPRGAKSRQISDKFETCIAPPMTPHTRRLTKISINNPIFMKELALISGSLISIIGVASIFWSQSQKIIGVLSCLAICFATYKLGRKIFNDTVRDVIETCILLQANAIKEFQPDVVVGSSYGGGIATFCVMRGIWNGPTILLAPAGIWISRLCQLVQDSEIRIPQDHWVHIVHGSKDTTIPLEHSQLLMKNSANNMNLKLSVVDDDHRLNKVCQDHLAEWILHAVGHLKDT